MREKFNSYGFINTDLLAPSPLRLCDFGLELRHNERYDYRNDERGAYEGYLFQFTLEGSGIFEASGEVIELNKRKAFFIPFPDRSRYYLPKEDNHSWKFFYIHFCGPVAAHFFNYVHQLKGPVFCLSDNSSSVRLFFDEYNSVKSGKQYQRYESGDFLYRFLTSLLRDVEMPDSSVQNAFVDEAVQWIHRNYGSQLSLAEMSGSIGVSLPHLTRQFHLQKGLSPMRYLTNIRIEHSISLLLNTTLTIGQIAEQCGFSNRNYYTKVFRKVMSTTPTEYRTMHE